MNIYIYMLSYMLYIIEICVYNLPVLYLYMFEIYLPRIHIWSSIFFILKNVKPVVDSNFKMCISYKQAIDDHKNH